MSYAGRAVSPVATAAAVVLVAILVGAGGYYAGNMAAPATMSTTTVLGGGSMVTSTFTSTLTLPALTSTATSTITQISTAIPQMITQTVTQTSTSVLTTTPVNFAFVPQPSNMHPSLPSGVKIRFLKYTDPSGVTLDGALWEPQTGQAKVVIITIPGTTGNYSGPPGTFSQGLNGTNRFGYIGAGLSTRGYAVFNAETRAGLTPGVDSAYDIPYSINAAVSVMKSLGYSNILLLGISLGGQSVVQYGAVFRDPAVKGLILNGAVANGPWRAKDGLANCAMGTYSAGSGCSLPPGLYNLMYNESKTLIAKGNPSALLPQKIPLAPWNGAPVAYGSWSAIYFYTYFGPDGVVTDNIVRAVTVPVITIRDQADSQNRAFENAWLVGNATAPGTLIPSFQNVLLPNSHAPYATAHTFDAKANGPLFITTIDTWIQGLNLK